MRIAIFYFSQTGNTRKVAEVMQEALAARAGFCALYRMEQTDPNEVLRYDLVGLGCPSFYFREPLNVQQFIQDIPVPPGPDHSRPVFIFITHGGTPAATLFRLKHLCRSRNLVTIGVFQCLGVDTFPPFADRRPLIAAGHPNETDLARAREFVLATLSAASDPRRPEMEAQNVVPVFGRILTSFFSDQRLRQLSRYGILPHKRILAQRCNRCSLCVQACPQGIISLRDLPVVSESGCIYCYHCQRSCPQQAIACNWTLFRIISGHYLRKSMDILFRKEDEKRP